MTSEFRPQRTLLRAVADLHVRGYQRLRIVPHIGGPGCWRCILANQERISAAHGACLAPGGANGRASYSSVGEAMYWGWNGGPRCSPARLAEVFLERFPELAKASYGPDWLYAGWFQHMLHVVYPDDLPISYDDYRPPGGGGDAEQPFVVPDHRGLP